MCDDALRVQSFFFFKSWLKVQESVVLCNCDWAAIFVLKFLVGRRGKLKQCPGWPVDDFRLVDTSGSECLLPMMSATSSDTIVDVNEVPSIESALADIGVGSVTGIRVVDVHEVTSIESALADVGVRYISGKIDEVNRRHFD